MNEEADRELSRHYRAASAEMPPPALGRVLRSAAAQAVTTAPRPWHRKWGPPMAMAASVVLGLGMVLRVALERPDFQATPAPVSASAPVSAPAAGAAPASTAAQRSESMAASTTAPLAVPAAKVRTAPAAPSQADAATVAVERQAPVPPMIADKKLAPSPSTLATTLEAKPQNSADVAVTASGARDLARAESSMRMPPVGAIAPAVPATPAAPAAAPAPESARAQARSQLESGAGQMTGPTAGPTAKAAMPAVQEQRSAPTAAPSARAKALGAGAEQDAESTELGITAEAELAPEEWLRRIVAWRRAARHAEADASLSRFVRRYPDHRIPELARAPQP